jgi:transcription initiation factor IIE alpha subunit
MAFVCPACNTEFETQEALEAHAREEHRAPQADGFRCAACNTEFETQESLEAHAKADHAA